MAALVASLIRGDSGLISQPIGVLANPLVVIIFYVGTHLFAWSKDSGKNQPVARRSPHGSAFASFVLPPSSRPFEIRHCGVLRLSLIVAGLVKYGGREVTVIASLVLGERYNVACLLFSPIDWLENKLSKRYTASST